MKVNVFKAERVLRGFTAPYVADQLGMSPGLYRKKERGEIHFSDEEKAKVMDLFGFTPEQVVDIFIR